ncbi:Uncharacterised protein [Listeria newyorkensis]|nr:Uncharacterised protein [Listeria newyorkensis]
MLRHIFTSKVATRFVLASGIARSKDKAILLLKILMMLR